MLWAIGWAIVAIFVHRVIEVLATPARETARTAMRLAENFRQAAAEAAKVPVAGEQLRRPFDSAAVTLGNLIDSANDQVVKHRTPGTARRLAGLSYSGDDCCRLLAAASHPLLPAGSRLSSLLGFACRPGPVRSSGDGCSSRSMCWPKSAMTPCRRGDPVIGR